MTIQYADRVKETSATTGTGPLSLDGAPDKFQTFVAGIGNAQQCYYCAVNDSANEWEVGLGTVTDGSPDTLARNTVLAGSNGQSLVNFTAGTKEVFVTVPGIKIPQEATDTTPGLVEKATTAEAQAGTAGKFPDAAGVHEAFKQFGYGGTNPDNLALNCNDLPSGSRNTWDGITESTAVSLNLPALGGSSSASRSWHVECFGLGSSRLVQEAAEVFGEGTARGRTFIRVKHDSTWHPWVESLHTSNIQSTTGQSTLYPMTQKAVTDELNNKQPLATVLTNTSASFTSALLTKLNGIATGATNTAAPVQPDWNASSGLAAIQNKPTIPTIPGVATTSANGLMSSEDKTKLNAVGTMANRNATISTGDPSGGADGDVWYKVD